LRKNKIDTVSLAFGDANTIFANELVLKIWNEIDGDPAEKEKGKKEGRN
jgi:hypothetical protein